MNKHLKIMRRAFSMIDFTVDTQDKLEYFLVKSNKKVAKITIKQGGKRIGLETYGQVKIVKDQIHNAWYKKILSPFISENEIKCRNIYNCIDTVNRTNIGTITFDPQYKTFVSSVKSPYLWISALEYELDTYTESHVAHHKDFSEILPILSTFDYETNILHSSPLISPSYSSDL